MAYWLLKSEPDTFGWDHQLALGAGGGAWTGVRNYQARNAMRAMQVGDLALFYHSNIGKAVVGIVRVTALSAPDPTTDDPRWDCVTVAALMPLPQPVSLATIKATPALAEMALVKAPRLSVQPVDPAHFALICRMGGLMHPPVSQGG
ncbi:Thymocyte nuclear protein 1 [Ketogulonicigenium robustum]|uniref:Thymocyte nuclear protein 1 n=1 Tax=Ketogulonicigenium robustum TaxID=92947 RepID=A0A1W6P287_9RHOB|nr:EVE domain-containing protein [Ketogulonicigenium robustum]ARO15625.1 Thymocyte nuclear protein 1 [Ketogulonicigenium robustum]